MQNLTGAAGAAISVLAILCATTPAHAQVKFAALELASTYNQTGPVSSDQSLVGYFSANTVYFKNQADVAAASVTYPGPDSPLSLTTTGYDGVANVYYLHSQTTYYASDAALSSDFPTGTYQYQWSGGAVGTGTASLDYSTEMPATTPLFTASTYTGAQGLNAANAFTFNWNNFAATANTPSEFFSITNASNNQTVFSQNFLNDTTTGITVSANTLQSGQSYIAQLVFDNRLDALSNGVTTEQEFDKYNTMSFSTAAVPEASSVLSFGILLGLGVLVMARKKAARRA